MLQSLLVPLDGSEFSERTLSLACDLAKATGASLHLAHVHVSHPPDHFLSNTQFHFEGLDMEEYEARHRDEEKAYLADIEAKYGQDAPVDTVLLEGHVAEEIAAYADRVSADMVLITTHGHTGMSRMWLGSVADALVRLTTLPLLVVHPAQGGHVPEDVFSFKHVMVPLDGSDLSATILGPAADLARASGARMTLVHVVSSSAVLGARIFPLLPDDLSPAIAKAGEYLEKLADELREDGLQVDVHVEEHEAPGRAIAALADKLDADVIALATHGYGGFKRALLGSVADKVLRSSALPLLVQSPSA
ncbi:MAG TPA: universal stress protein [Longimicrobiales bacterium]|nr:universal stress protein [Longimicrobiales bacterium]